MATPPASYGYPQAAITADKLPLWQQPLARFTVAGAKDWKVSSLASIDRGIRVEAGQGSGDAVTDVTFEYETMSLPSPTIPSAWYLIVRRRNWSGTGTSKLAYIRGTATKALPKRSDTPGAESDQPLALVRVTQKDTTVQEIVDLRCFASNGGVEVVDRLALSYLEAPGAAVKLGPAIWRYEPQGNGVWGWANYALTTSAGFSGSTGWGVVGEVERIGGSAGAVRLRAAVRLQRLGASFSVASTSGFVPLTGAVLPDGHRPVNRNVDVPAALTSAADTWGGSGVMRLGVNGAMSYLPLQPAQQTIGAGACFHISAEWFAV